MATEPNIHAVHDHEHTDMNIAAIVWFGVGLTVSAIIIYFALGWLYWYFDTHYAYGQPISPYSPLRQLPPYPRLQVSPQVELREFRAKEEQLLNGYGWEDKSKGVVRIPIDRAMDLIAQRGLPAVQAPVDVSGFPRNPATATKGQVTTPRGTSTAPGNPGGLPTATVPQQGKQIQSNQPAGKEQ